MRGVLTATARTFATTLGRAASAGSTLATFATAHFSPLTSATPTTLAPLASTGVVVAALSTLLLLLAS